MKDAKKFVGQSFPGVTLELTLDSDVTRPRVGPVDTFQKDVRVEFPMRLREEYPIGTRFVATVKVCQKHDSSGHAKGDPYLRASDIRPIPSSTPTRGLVANQKPGSISGRSYAYDWQKTRKKKAGA